MRQFRVILLLISIILLQFLYITLHESTSPHISEKIPTQQKNFIKRIFRLHAQKFSNHTFYQFPQLSPTIDQTIQSLNPSNINSITGKPTFLLPMIPFSEGPNNLIRVFKETALIAHQAKQNLVIPIFHTHGRMNDGTPMKSPFQIPINLGANKLYDVDLIYNIDDTFDTATMTQKLGLVDSHSFQKICHNQIDLLVKCGNLIINHNEGRNYYLRASGLQVKNEVHIKDISEYPKILENLQTSCYSIILGKDCLLSDQQWLKDRNGR